MLKKLSKVSTGGAQSIKYLDVVFCLDITGSMGTYLNQATNTIKTIMNEFTVRSDIRHIETRFGFVGYRDHPP